MTQDEIIELADKALENAEYGDYGNKELNKAITAIKEALAHPEPVAWWNDTGTHIDLNVSGRGIPLYITPPPCPTCEALARTVMMNQTGRDA